jgi:hypothetical protein
MTAKLNGDKIKLFERLAGLESAFKAFRSEIKGDIGEIKDNHLASIYKKIDLIETRLNKRPTWLLSIIITFLSSIIFLLAGLLIGGLK